MNIDSYTFGKIVIDGKEYDDDVIILPQSVQAGWWRVEGHEVTMFDLADIVEHSPKRLIIGTGASGNCRVMAEVFDYCKKEKIELIVKPTPEAVVEYNGLEDKGATVAALHLTC